jgi:AraC-like DNA-binding protein
MLQISLQAKQLHHAIEEISQAIEAESYEVACDEHRAALSPALGQGSFHGIDFDNGLGLFFCQLELQEPLSLQLLPESATPLRFICCSGGSVTHSLTKALEPERIEVKYRLTPSVSTLCASREHHPQHWLLPAAEAIEMVILEVARSEFFAKIECDDDLIPDELAQALQPNQQGTFFFRVGNYGAQLSKTLQEIFENPFVDLERKSYLEAKAMELFAVHMRHFRLLQDANDTSHVGLHEDDLIKLQQLHDFIDDHLGEALTIDRLAGELGMSKSKLKKSFKLLYHQSLGRYVREQRMSRARQLLMSAEFSIGEVAQQVGYHNHGHFSRQFKETFGMSPRAFIPSLSGKDKQSSI